MLALLIALTGLLVIQLTQCLDVITTIAGTGTSSYSGDSGQATSATLHNPTGIALDSSGNVYFDDLFNNRIRKIVASTGIITTVAGSGATGTGSYSGDDGQASSATLANPIGITLDSLGNIYIADQGNHRIRKVMASTGIITTIAGTGTNSYSGDNGPATSAELYFPTGVAVDSSGNVYIADYINNRIRKVTVSTGIINTFAGTGIKSYSGDTGQATAATLCGPETVAVDSSGNVYIADECNHAIRKVTASTGVITTIAGTGSTSSSIGDGGAATSATLSTPYGVTLDASGNVYIADYGNNRIRKVTVSTGIITTVAGTGTASYSGDGSDATSAALYAPFGVCLDAAGNMYISDWGNQRIRKVTTYTASPSVTPTTSRPSSATPSVAPTAIPTASPTTTSPSSTTPTFKPTIYPSLSPSTVFIITTIAGTGTSSYSGDGGQATSATLNLPTGIALDVAGNVYISDSLNYRIRKVTVSTGIITTIAGTGTNSYSGDGGAATAATLNSAIGVTLDLSGNVYIADGDNQRVRKVTVSTGIINTIAGTGTFSYSGDNGPATSATLRTPYGIALDTSGNVYIADENNHRIRKLTASTGIITTIAGSSESGSFGDNGQATSAGLYFPMGVALDSSGNVYIADAFDYRVRKVTVSTGIITTIAGTGTTTYSGDNGPATSAALNYPRAVALDAAGNVYIADHINCRIRKVTVSTGIITTFAGTGACSNTINGDGGAATSAALYYTYGVALDASDNVYLVDNRIRKVTIGGTYGPTQIPTALPSNPTSTPSLPPSRIPTTNPTLAPSITPTAIPTLSPTTASPSTATPTVSPTSYPSLSPSTVFIITTIAGTGSTTYNGDGSAATSASLYNPNGVAVDSSGNVYIADYNHNRIRKVTVSTGIITTIAGTGASSYSGDNGQATSAAVSFPQGLNLDSSGNVYIADSGNCRVRKVTVSTGIITTIAGTGSSSYGGDTGQATSAALNYPTTVALDSSGNLFIADKNNNRIRKVTVSTSVITTVAGNGGTGSYSGDTGQATSAALNYPSGVALDSLGNIFITDSYNHRIRKVTVSTGVITTIAGTGTVGYGGDNGPATSATLSYPIGIALDSSGNVYFSSGVDARIRKVTVSTGIITTIVGTGSASYGGDNGPASSAALFSPSGIALDSSGNVYIADTLNHRVRKVTLVSTVTSTVTPSCAPSAMPSTMPSSTPTTMTPSVTPTINIPTPSPTRNPTPLPGSPSATPSTAMPSIVPTAKPTATPSTLPSLTPTTAPTEPPSASPSASPTSSPTTIPTSLPSTATPTLSPTDYPSLSPSIGIITTIAGASTSSGFSGDNGQATSAALYNPYGVDVDASGNVYIADTYNHRIRKVTVSTGIITTFAGTGSTSYGGDNGLATSATLYAPFGVALDSSGNVYIADSNNNRVRKVTESTSIITTIAGTGTGTYSGNNGPATSAALNGPHGIVLDASGNVYFSDYYNHVIRKVTVSTSIITTIAGVATAGYSGDNGPATTAGLYYPYGVALDSSGNVYIADSYNHRIRKVTVSTGIITTLAGIGTSSYGGDNGPATSAGFSYPAGVALDALGNVYIADEGNQRIRKVTVLTGIITTFAGTGIGSYSGDNGQATSATLCAPEGVALDSSGNVYIAESSNQCIRKVTVSTTSSPSNSPTQPPSYTPTAVPSYTPSASPSTAKPSSVPTTMTPSYTPTMSPSSYPTYMSSVRVYFMVTQVLSGISAATYSSSRESNDAVLKQTVVNMLGYDCKLEDVTIQQASDYSSATSRSLSLAAAAVETELMYSVTTPTRIFNDTNTATALFIQALNESIATGAFDVLLHTSGNADWLSATTNYVIFSTASPTSSPTSWPTSAPTKRDNIAANLLSAPLTSEAAKEKINYYLGAFVGYFLSIYVCLYLYSILRYGRATATKLYDSAYQSSAYVKTSAAATSESAILFDFYLKNEVVGSTIRLGEELKEIKHESSKGAPLKELSEVDEVARYTRGYREYMQQQRTLLGCSPFLYPEGYAVKIPCTSRHLVFPPGRVEDILLFLCHNHPLFTCFYFMDGSKLGAHGTRILYIGKDVAVFVLYQFSNMLLQYFMLDGIGLGTFINLFIITPSAVSVGLLLKYLYTCPFTETVEFQRKYAAYESVLLFFGRLAILPIMIIMCGSLIIACLFSSNRDVPLILINYFIYVQFYGVLLAIAKAVLLFIDGYYYKLSLFGVLDVLCIGQLYKERILAEQLVVDVDYAYRIRTYFCGLIKVQKILNRDDAIKANWITAVTGGGGSLAEEAYAIEMKGADGDDEDNNVVENPLVTTSTSRNTISFNLDSVYGASNDEDREYAIYGDSYESADSMVVENPIYSSTTYSQSGSSSKVSDALRLQQSAINTSSTAAAMDDEQSLYEEYQHLQSKSDDAVYDMNETISFEEWKLKKQFKQGTRSSFVKAFQVFEEREQLFTSDSSKVSASVANTMHLQANFKVKNVLATRTNPAAAKLNHGK